MHTAHAHSLARSLALSLVSVLQLSSLSLSPSAMSATEFQRLMELAIVHELQNRRALGFGGRQTVDAVLAATTGAVGLPVDLLVRWMRAVERLEARFVAQTGVWLGTQMIWLRRRG